MTALHTPSTANQCAEILATLRAGRGLTPIEALAEFRCFRLAARIYDLRKSGHPIATVWQAGEGKRWARYHLLPAGDTPDKRAGA